MILHFSSASLCLGFSLSFSLLSSGSGGGVLFLPVGVGVTSDTTDQLEFDRVTVLDEISLLKKKTGIGDKGRQKKSRCRNASLILTGDFTKWFGIVRSIYIFA
jgi:hypothetical protein